MTVDIRKHLADLMRAALVSLAPDQVDAAIVLERPRQASHGDFACNLAMQLARTMKRNPRELAQLLLLEIPRSPLVAKIELYDAATLYRIDDIRLRGAIAIGDSLSMG
jgi:arginyl-tRNA synthetase